MTYSGRLISRGEGVPSIADIALSLSRLPRFGGHSLRWWSVLDHTLFVYRLALADNKHRDADLLMSVLLHDAHESLTGDIPTWMKTDDMREFQRELDQRLMRAHHPLGFDGYAARKAEVNELDRRALLAEALVVGPPQLAMLEPDVFSELMLGGKAEYTDLEVLRQYLRTGRVGTPSTLGLGHTAPNVREFVRFYESLSASLRPAVTART